MVVPYEEVSVEVTLTDISWQSTGFEFGLQRGRHDLEPGLATSAGEQRYEVQLRLRRADGGTVRWSGPFANGTAAEPFLYLGLRRVPGESAWVRRMKILLPTELDPDVSAIRARVRDVGATRVQFDDPGWEFIV